MSKRNDISTEELIAYAVESGLSLSAAAKRMLPQSAARRAWRRAQKHVRKHVLGQEALDLLFKRGARCDLVMSGRLVCEPEDISDLIVRGHVPIIEACDGLEGKRKFYQILYNRITREYGKNARTKLKKQADSPPSNFFTITDDELGHAG